MITKVEHKVLSDKYLKNNTSNQKPKRLGKGFDEILKREESKYVTNRKDY